MYWSRSTIALVLLNAVSALAQESTLSQHTNDSLFWGPYRPNLYFGIRPRIPNSLSTGLLWGRVEDYNNVQNRVRFTCEQNEGMGGYGWDVFDPRTGGVQTIKDKENGIDVETSFVKFDEGRGGWGARIKGTVREDAEPGIGSQGGVREQLKTSIWFTLGVGGVGSLEVQDAEAGHEQGVAGDVILNGQTADLGDFKLTVTESTEGNSHPLVNHAAYRAKPLDHTLVHSVQVPEEALWQSKAVVFSSMKTTIDAYVEEYGQEKMPPPWQTYTIQNRPGAGNMHVVQKVYEGSFEFDVFYTPSTASSTPTSEDLTKAIHKVIDDFDSKFAKVLAPQAPYKSDDYLRFGKSLFSNLIGGIGYFQGDQVVDRSYDAAYDEENEGFWTEAAEARSLSRQAVEGPYELFTSVPSRPFFPRGFLWDEGFHLLPILDWDPEVAMEVVGSWFRMMDADGWIAREVILGNEARSKVPQEFQVQYPHYANPPTLFMVLEGLLDKAQESGANRLKAWLGELYPLLQRNFDWYRKTQYGDLKSYDRSAFSSKEAYRWRGRTPTHVLTSGLDDYPRPQPPHPGELHVDLMAWMGMMARGMRRIATYLDESDDAARYSKIAEAIRRNTDDLHWSKQDKTYCDASIDDFEENMLVCHKGYLSIFPFMTGLIGPEHEHLGDVLALIANEEELWSPFGVRSLSMKDEFYGTEENYWRSPVWMNMNYLIIERLYDIATQPGPQQVKASKMYTALRKNVVETVYKSWRDTGFAWEQYNPDTGEGQRIRHFTGWTSLVVKVMNMPEKPVVGAKRTRHDEL